VPEPATPALPPLSVPPALVLPAVPPALCPALPAPAAAPALPPDPPNGFCAPLPPVAPPSKNPPPDPPPLQATSVAAKRVARVERVESAFMGRRSPDEVSAVLDHPHRDAPLTKLAAVSSTSKTLA
jgi:hypothetical protein